MITFNAVMSLALIVMFVWSATNHLAARRRDLSMARMIHRIDELLTTWAEHWGDPHEDVKPLLAQVIQRWKTERREAERRHF